MTKDIRYHKTHLNVLFTDGELSHPTSDMRFTSLRVCGNQPFINRPRVATVPLRAFPPSHRVLTSFLKVLLRKMIP